MTINLDLFSLHRAGPHHDQSQGSGSRVRGDESRDWCSTQPGVAPGGASDAGVQRSQKTQTSTRCPGHAGGGDRGQERLLETAETERGRGVCRECGVCGWMCVWGVCVCALCVVCREWVCVGAVDVCVCVVCVCVCVCVRDCSQERLREAADRQHVGV